MKTVALNKRFQNSLTIRLDVFCSYKGKVQILIYTKLKFKEDFIRNKYFMTLNNFVLKGELNEKIVVVRFFFAGYIFMLFFYFSHQG